MSWSKPDTERVTGDAAPDLRAAFLSAVHGLEVRIRPGELPEHGQRLMATLGARVVYDVRAPRAVPMVDPHDARRRRARARRRAQR